MQGVIWCCRVLQGCQLGEEFGGVQVSDRLFFFFFFSCGIVSPVEVSLSGADLVDPLQLFKKMPHFAVVDDLAYFSYVADGAAAMCSLNLSAFELAPFVASGPSRPSIPSSNVVPTEGAFFRGYYYLVLSSSSVWRISLKASEPVWEPLPVFGAGPVELTGNTLVWNNCIWVLCVTEAAIFSLDLARPEWKKHATKNPPGLALRDCYLPRLFDDKLVLIRKSDFSELWMMDMSTKVWTREDSYGQRPGNYATNPSFTIHGNNLYCLGGQLTGQVQRSNHIRKLALKKVQVTREERLQGKLATMFQDNYCDVVFVFPGDNSKMLRAHRSILCQYDVFRAMFSGHFAENARKLVKVGTTELYASVVEIHDFSVEAFKAVLQFFYECLDLENTQADLMELFQLADMYLLDSLKEEIVNCVALARDALGGLELYKALIHDPSPTSKRLKRKAEEIFEKDMDAIRDTEEFRTYIQNNPEDVGIILQHLLPKKLKR